jgi:hypothetical protein
LEFAALFLGFEKLMYWNLTIVGGQTKTPIVASIVYGPTYTCDRLVLIQPANNPARHAVVDVAELNKAVLGARLAE